MKNDPKHEILKSALIGITALAALVCWLTLQPRLPNLEPKEKIGKKLFEDFNDPGKMTRIEFTGIDPSTGDVRSLTLVRDEQDWSLPGMSGFPAENADRLAKIVAPLMQLTVLDVVDETAKTSDVRRISDFHRECGLISPQTFEVDRELFVDARSTTDNQENAEKDNVASDNLAQGAALQVRIEGEAGEPLLELLIGARVPESSATRDNRFIRLPNEEVVYTADFIGDSTQEAGTTEFIEYPDRVSFDAIDWIDRDLLRISRWDILNLTSRDYSFSIQRDDKNIRVANYQSTGVVVFKQTPENSMSRVWSLERRFNQEKSGAWKEIQEVDPNSANNDALNTTADILGALKITDVRKKPAALAELFHASNTGAALLSHAETLSDFGFATADLDPLNPSRIEPILIGEGGAIDLTMKTGVKISLLFGHRFEEKRAVLAYASFSRDALASATEDESEIAFLEPEARQKADIKNERFADWFYLIDEADYQKLQFRVSDTLK